VSQEIIIGGAVTGKLTDRRSSEKSEEEGVGQRGRD